MSRRTLLVSQAVVVMMCGCAARAPQSPAPAAASPERPQRLAPAALADETPYPVSGLMPREETGVAAFLKDHPEYDGRGVVVAIFDTGVDPGAPGFQTTPQGQPKIIDMIDGSGSGDVDTSEVRQAANGTLEGLSGRTLRIPDSWHNPTGEYHLGLKPAYELFPQGVVERLRKKRTERWLARQREAVAEVTRRLADWDAAHPDPTPEQRRERDDLARLLEELDKMGKDFEDPGPVFDCVVFHDGEVWRAAIDTDEDGDLADEDLLTDYQREHRYSTFSDEDLLNFAVNIYDEGNLLSIVDDGGGHGTHVAGIVGAYFPDQPELNGMAPGVQFVVVKIGDTRMGTQSMGTGEIRGVSRVLRGDVDLINMSYGGPTPDPNDGRLTRIYSEVVNDHGVIWVCSAGNSGPALSTVGAPGGTTSALIGVGAYVSPKMIEAQYALRELLPESWFTWSSRGPTYDGDLGVTCSAPGAAVSPLPNWWLRRNARFNGTSMASPSVCGGLALLLSGLKQEGWQKDRDYTPWRLRRAIERTARRVEGTEVFAQGAGLVQIDTAWDYLHRWRDAIDNDIRFEISIPERQNARGIYLREPDETDRPLEATINVTPGYPKDAPHRPKLQLDLRLRLEATAPWVQVPSYLAMSSGTASFSVLVEPQELEPGVHFAEIRALDVAAPDRGPVFVVPVTVIVPEPVGADDDWAVADTLDFAPGQIHRRFLAVPLGATWAELRLRRPDDRGPNRMVIHALQVVPDLPFTSTHYNRRTDIGPFGEQVHTFAVTPGRTLELALAQYWMSLGTSTFEYELQFHGLAPEPQEICVTGGNRAARVDITALRHEAIQPEASLTVWRQRLRPVRHELRPLGERDVLPKGRRIHELILQYEFELDGEARVVPRPVMTLHEETNESIESQLWMLFDENRRRLATGYNTTDPIKLAKGRYTVRFHMRHDDVRFLRRFEDMVLHLDRHLDKPIVLKAYGDIDDALAGEGQFTLSEVQPGQRVPVFFAMPAPDDLPKGATAGDLLLGTAYFGRKQEDGTGRRPGGFPVTYAVPPKPAPEEKGDGEAERDPLERLREDVLDAQVSALAALRKANRREEFDQLLAEVLESKPGHLPALLEALRFEADHGEPEAVIEAADRILGQIDTTALAAALALKPDPEDREAKKERKQLEDRKAALVEALRRKCEALLARHPQPPDEPGAEDPFEAAFAALQQWADADDEDFIAVRIDREMRRGRLGEALALLNERIEKTPAKRRWYEKRLVLFEKAGWKHWIESEQRWMLIRFPRAYPPF